MIRQATPADAEAIARIYNVYVRDTAISFETAEVSAEEMRRRIAGISASYPYFVCEEGGEIKGYCYAHAWKEREAYSRTLETTVYLRRDCCGAGRGALLMTRLIAACRAAGFKALIACITAGNDASVALHERLGFRQVSRFRQVGRKFGRWLDVVDLELLLTDE